MERSVMQEIPNSRRRAAREKAAPWVSLMRARRQVLVCLLAAAGVACSGDRSASLTEEQGHQVATAMLDSIVESFNREDGVAYGANYWPDADLVGFDGAVFEGRDAIIRNHVEMWAGPLKGAKIRGEVRKLLVLPLNVVVVDVNLARESDPTAGPARIKFVMERRAEVWKIAAAQNTLTSTGSQ
jgi:uncharacterized protein (TIGR02246 family)